MAWPRSRFFGGFVLLLFSGFFVVACATTSGMQDTRGEGLSRFYQTGFERIWQAALRSVEANGFQLDRADDYDRFIVATRRTDRRGPGVRDDEVALQADQGVRVAIFVDSVAPGTWEVEVVNRPLFRLHPTPVDWTPDIFRVLERELQNGDREDVRVPPPDSPLEYRPR